MAHRRGQLNGQLDRPRCADVGCRIHHRMVGPRPRRTTRVLRISLDRAGLLSVVKNSFTCRWFSGCLVVNGKAPRWQASTDQRLRSRKPGRSTPSSVSLRRDSSRSSGGAGPGARPRCGAPSRLIGNASPTRGSGRSCRS
jgi:hypothetical protein